MKKKTLVINILKSASIIYVSLFSTNLAINTFKNLVNFSVTDFGLFIAIWILSIATLLCISMLENNAGKVIVVILLGISGLFTDFHYKIFGTSLHIESVSPLWTNRSMFSDAFDMYWQLVLLPVFRFILYIAASLYPTPKPVIHLARWKTYIAAILCMLLVFQFNSQIDEEEAEGQPAYFATIPFFVGQFIIYLNYKTVPRDEVDIPVLNDRSIEKVILIVDESIRGDFIDLNYMRETTPFLSSIKKRIANFGLALSAYNSSAGSNVIMRNGIKPKEFMGSEGRKLFSNPSIWQYAKKAGYRTIYLDAQRKQKDFEDKYYNNYMDESEAGYIDTFIGASADALEKDNNMARKIREIIKRPGKDFIYLVKSGVHFHYENRYPHEKRIFTPTLVVGVPSTDRARLVNSYKNAIRWNVNEFFKTLLLPDISLKNTAIVYTSDHGQNLFDDGEKDTMLLHSTPRSRIVQQAIVPMFVITDNLLFKEYLRKAVQFNLNRCTHFQIFPTLLNMMGYDKEAVVNKYYSTLLDPVTENFVYFTGNIKYGKHIPVKVNPNLYFYIK